MANVAILIGNSQYLTNADLPCCLADVEAMRELISATERYEKVHMLLNLEATTLKDQIRNMIDASGLVEELFFYFTGHGFQLDSEFFYCATNFDAKRPNETGLSNAELHALLRSPSANLVVKVIDACSSGTLLIKGDGSFLPAEKAGLKNFIQIASCLDSQNSLTGNPLSLFTDKFRAATLKKQEGAVYYTDVVNTLRDDFLGNSSQTPHFVTQGTGRETFVDDAKLLNAVRARLLAGEVIVSTDSTINESTPPNPLTLLSHAEGKFVQKEVAYQFIDDFLTSVVTAIEDDEDLREVYNAEIVIHSDYEEEATKAFIVRVLSQEKRRDNFVFAETGTTNDEPDLFNPMTISGMLRSRRASHTYYSLRLNSKLPKAQLKITFVPKLTMLKQLVLIVTCAPSLEKCFSFEMLQEHPLKDWGIYDKAGSELARRWYRFNWDANTSAVVEKIRLKIKESTRANIEEAVKSLS